MRLLFHPCCDTFFLVLNLARPAAQKNLLVHRKSWKAKRETSIVIGIITLLFKHHHHHQSPEKEKAEEDTITPFILCRSHKLLERKKAPSFPIL